MRRPWAKISTLLWDVGGVLFTNAWDRNRALNLEAAAHLGMHAIHMKDAAQLEAE
jgi:hypothetical protein